MSKKKVFINVLTYEERNTYKILTALNNQHRIYKHVFRNSVFNNMQQSEASVYTTCIYIDVHIYTDVFHFWKLRKNESSLTITA